MECFAKVLPAQPYFIPGYAGFVPGYTIHYGHTFGKSTHDILCDKDIKRSDRPVLAELSKDKNEWMTSRYYQAIQDRCRSKGCKYAIDMIPGYQGHLPQYSFVNGHKFTTSAAFGLCEFEKMRQAHLYPEYSKLLQWNELKKWEKEIKDVDGYTQMPKEIPGDATAFMEMYEKRLSIPPSKSSKFFMDHLPRKNSAIGNTKPNITLPVRQKNNSMGSVNDEIDEQPKPTVRHELPYETGIIKNYAGHVPGSVYIVGQSFFEGSKNTRNIMRMNYSKQN